MERIKDLNRFQKGVLAVVLVMVLVFTALYAVTGSRRGFAYKDSILTPTEENGTTVYSGTISGTDAQFTVTADLTVTFTYGEQTYGPYTAREDPSAVPEEDQGKGYMTGVEILDDGEVFFRGGVWRSGDDLMLFNEEGGIQMSIGAVMSDGTVVDGYGNTVDRMAPSAGTILELMDGPKLVSKGVWLAWGCGTFVCFMTLISLLFADEIFRWNLSFRIQNVEHAEPSEWEMAGRYIGWTILPILAAGMYIMGLNSIA